MAAGATLVLLACLALCLPSLRDRLTATPVPGNVKIESGLDLGPEGKPLGNTHVSFKQNGWRTDDGKALFWVWYEEAGRGKWALLRLPDCRIMCTVSGFDQVFWTEGALAIGARLAPGPWADAPVPQNNLFKWLRYRARYWEIDCQTGKVTRFNVDSLPPTWEPMVVVDRSPAKQGGTRGKPWVFMVPPHVPGSDQVSEGELQWALNRATRVLSVEVSDFRRRTSGNRKVCDFPAGWEPQAMCSIDDDRTIIILRASDASREDEAHVLTVSTGKMEKIDMRPAK